MKLNIKKYDDDDAFYVVNEADYDLSLNSTKGDPAIIQALRRETIDILLRTARAPEENVVKVAMGSKPPANKVKGYATFLRFLEGSDLAELERRLGFKENVLQAGGAYVYKINPSLLNPGNIAPRGNTDWPGGVSPRDLYNVSQKHGVKVAYHRSYPPASSPIIQFVILEPVPVLDSPRFLTTGQAL